jgi:hypothetical protein
MHAEISPKLLILTPVKNATRYLPRYVELIERLDWPREALSIGILESDSRDSTMDALEVLRPRLNARAQNVTILNADFGFHMPDDLPRWTPALQLARRAALARSRNRLLFGALRDEDWVLWIDVDVVDYPPDTIARLLNAGRDILHPHCVMVPNGPSFDLNAWAGGGTQTMHDLRGTQGPVRLDSVGGTMLLVRADLHREGLVFPPFRYGVKNSGIRDPHPVWGGGEIETEGLAMMARDMGYQCWGLPDFEIFHAKP